MLSLLGAKVNYIPFYSSLEKIKTIPAAAALIDDFGMELVGLETPTYDEDAQVDIEYLNGIHKDYVVDIANMLMHILFLQDVQQVLLVMILSVSQMNLQRRESRYIQ